MPHDNAKVTVKVCTDCLPETPDGPELQGSSQNLMVSFSITLRIVDRFEHTRGVIRSVNPATEHLLHEHNVFVLMQIVKRPNVYLHELQRVHAQTAGMFVSEATICRMLKHFGFSRKVIILF